MAKQFNRDAALKAGHTNEAINTYLAQNPDIRLMDSVNSSSPVTIPQGQTFQPTPQQGGFDLKNFLLGALPTAGAVLGGIAGGTGGALVPGADLSGVPEVAGAIGGSGVGQGAGKALQNYLQKKPVGQDVPGNVGIGAVAGAGGELVGPLLGKVLGKMGDSIASGGLNLTRSMSDKYAAEAGESVAQTLTKNGLAGVNKDALDQGIGKLDEIYSKIANSDTPVHPDIFIKNAADAVSNLRSQLPGSAKSLANKVEQELQDNVLGNFDHTSTLADYNAAKKAYAAQTTASQFNADPGQYNVNRIVGNILRKTVNQGADQAGLKTAEGKPLSELGTNLMRLRDIADVAAGRVSAGGGGSPFSLTNLVLGGETGLAAAALGANPVIGLAAPAARMGINALQSNPAFAGPLSGILSGAGQQVAQKSAPVLTGGASALGQLLFGSTGKKNTQNQESQNQPGPGIDQQNNAGSGNVFNDINHSGSVPPDVQNSQVVKSFDGKDSFPAQLPTLSNVTNTIPNQPYSPELQAQDISRAAALPTIVQQTAAYNQIQAKKQLNDQYVQQYTQQNQLDPSSQDFMRTAQPVYQNFNDLRTLVQQQGNDSVFQSMLSDSPQVQQYKMQSDPTGDYAKMVQLMQVLKGEAGAQINAGKPSRFTLNMTNIGPGNSKAANLGILDAAQKEFVNQYKQYLPYYNLSLQSPQQSPLQQVGIPIGPTPQQNSQPPTGFGAPAVQIPGQGGGGNGNPYSFVDFLRKGLPQARFGQGGGGQSLPTQTPLTNYGYHMSGGNANAMGALQSWLAARHLPGQVITGALSAVRQADPQFQVNQRLAQGNVSVSPQQIQQTQQAGINPIIGAAVPSVGMHPDDVQYLNSVADTLGDNGVSQGAKQEAMKGLQTLADTYLPQAQALGKNQTLLTRLLRMSGR